MDTPARPNEGAAQATGYDGSRPDIQALVPRDATRILELGCSSGGLGAALKRRQSVHVTGVELDPASAERARHVLDDVHRMTAEEYLRTSRDAAFDCLICADVLEHLIQPASVLTQAVARLVEGATVVVSLPNILYWPEFKRLLKGDWPQDPEGIFDRTHLRWFTPDSSLRMLTEVGLHDIRYVPGYWRHRRRDRVVRAVAGGLGLARFQPAQLLYVATASVESTARRGMIHS